MRPLIRVIGLFGPSGAGKTTLTRLLPARWPALYESMPTVSTRAPRHDDAGLYATVSPTEFDRLSATGAFIAQTEIRALAERRFYGYRRSDAEDAAARGRILVAPLERQLTECLRARLPREQILVVGLLPPGRDVAERIATLESRLAPRYHGSPYALAERLANARDEDLPLMETAVIDLVVATDASPEITADRVHEAARRWFSDTEIARSTTSGR
jgi:guanylate kinase